MIFRKAQEHFTCFALSNYQAEYLIESFQQWASNLTPEITGAAKAKQGEQP